MTTEKTIPPTEDLGGQKQLRENVGDPHVRDIVFMFGIKAISKMSGENVIEECRALIAMISDDYHDEKSDHEAVGNKIVGVLKLAKPFFEGSPKIKWLTFLEEVMEGLPRERTVDDKPQVALEKTKLWIFKEIVFSWDGEYSEGNREVFYLIARCYSCHASERWFTHMNKAYLHNEFSKIVTQRLQHHEFVSPEALESLLSWYQDPKTPEEVAARLLITIAKAGGHEWMMENLENAKLVKEHNLRPEVTEKGDDVDVAP